jgi:hypothetical protein
VASGQTDYNVDAVTFVRTWQNAGSAQEVADALKMPKDIVHARASMYRGAGVKLKRMPRHSTKAIDVAGLNKLIEEVDQEAGRKTPTPRKKKTSDIPDGPVLVGETIKGILDKLHAGEEIFAKAVGLTTTFFDCPRCGRRSHFREVFVERENHVCIEPEEALTCRECGHGLTKEEARPMPQGVLRSGWWFTCRSCRGDSFVDETVHGEDAVTGYPTEMPPPRVKCEHCGEENVIELGDD